MAKSEKLRAPHRTFIAAQRMFFVATAARDGWVNVSPKGMDTLRVLSDERIVWLNLTGSGNETASHVQDMPRMTLMFCAFEGNALILRVYGDARTVHPRDPEWEELSALFPRIAGSRQVFDIGEIRGVQTSCGTGVPEMAFLRDRADTELVPFYEDMGEDGVTRYWKRKNLRDINGRLTGISPDGN